MEAGVFSKFVWVDRLKNLYNPLPKAKTRRDGSLYHPGKMLATGTKYHYLCPCLFLVTVRKTYH
eukprot:3348717-Amphidinium_carterae.1